MVRLSCTLVPLGHDALFACRSDIMVEWGLAVHLTKHNMQRF